MVKKADFAELHRTAVKAEMDAEHYKARLAEAEALILEVLRYPHKANSPHSTWQKRAHEFVRPADSASGEQG